MTYLAWTLVGVTIKFGGIFANLGGFVTSRQRWVAALVGDSLWLFGGVADHNRTGAIVAGLVMALDLWLWRNSRDDDDDQDKKRRLRSAARSHLPRPVVRTLRPVDTAA